jgi:HD-GYP domain-containing protein (c-di-GMP phosphodiesterase class II)
MSYNFKDDKSLSESGMYEAISNTIFNFMNYSYPSVSSTTFKRLGKWALENGYSPEEIYSDRVKLALNFKIVGGSKGVFSKLNERVFFTNDEFLNLLSNLYEKRPEKYREYSEKEFFIDVGFYGGSSLENIILDHVFPSLFSSSLQKIATYSSLYAAYATRQRIVDFSSNLDGDLEEISLILNGLPGNKTDMSSAALFYGYVKKVLKKSLKIHNSTFKYYPSSGSFKISVLSKKKGENSFDWRQMIEDSNFAVKLLTSPLVKSKIETENRLETLDNIIKTFTVGISKDISSLKRADLVSGEHNVRVGYESLEIGNFFGLSDREKRAIAYGAPQHDLGKVIIPQNILLNEGKLKEEEFRIMQEHTTFGASLSLYNGFKIIENIFTRVMLRNLDSRFRKGFGNFLKKTLEDVVVQGSSIILHHQEYANGKGYPLGLKSEETSRPIKLVQVVDFKDAFSSPRPYKEAHTFEKVLEVLNEELYSGHFDFEIGNFLINHYFIHQHKAGRSLDTYILNKRKKEYSLYEQLVLGFIRGNLPKEVLYSKELLSKGNKIISEIPEIYYTKEELISKIKSHLVGFYEDVIFQEKIRKILENGVELDSKLREEFENSRQNRIFNIYSLSSKAISFLRNLHFNEKLNSEENLRYLRSRISEDFHNLMSLSIENNIKWKRR